VKLFFDAAGSEAAVIRVEPPRFCFGRGGLGKVEGECGGNSTSQLSVSNLVGNWEEASIADETR
jgi:hypothetical protein